MGEQTIFSMDSDIPHLRPNHLRCEACATSNVFRESGSSHGKSHFELHGVLSSNPLCSYHYILRNLSVQVLEIYRQLIFRLFIPR
jgi:hypothetical protein